MAKMKVLAQFYPLSLPYVHQESTPLPNCLATIFVMKIDTYLLGWVHGRGKQTSATLCFLNKKHETSYSVIVYVRRDDGTNAINVLLFHRVCYLSSLKIQDKLGKDRFCTFSY